MKKIPLTNGGEALVSDKDFPSLAKHRWNRADNGSTSYAVRCEYVREKRRKRTVIMHRVIANAPKGRKVDHRNRNGLDNRRSNLRLATDSQNQYNTKLRKDSTTGFRGVTLLRGKFMAQIQSGKTHKYLGWFETAEAAATAYDAAAILLHGEFAQLNFPKRPIA